MICASVGDSRAVIAMRDGNDLFATPLSEDHKPENVLEKERIEAAGGYVFMDRVKGGLAMSR